MQSSVTHVCKNTVFEEGGDDLREGEGVEVVRTKILVHPLRLPATLLDAAALARNFPKQHSATGIRANQFTRMNSDRKQRIERVLIML